MLKIEKACGIILSGAYIATGMVSEVGRIPPAFLPIANQRLYCRQVEVLSQYVNSVTLTTPQGFELEPFDFRWLRSRNVNLCPTDERKTLGEALAYCLAQLHDDIEDIWLMFGDTLVTDLSSLVPHSVAVGIANEHSRWGYCRTLADGLIEFYEDFQLPENEKKAVVVGCFRLGRREFARCLAQSGNDYYGSLGLYAKKHPLTLVDTSASWYDFGHINAYFRSRQHFTTERNFNNLHIDKRKVTKYSDETLKMLAEIEWYENIPRDISVFVPGYRGRTKQAGLIGYATEYLFLPLISDLFLYARMPEYVWHQIFRGCKEFLERCREYKGIEEIASDSWWLYANKTEERLKSYSVSRQISLQKTWLFNGSPMPSLEDMYTQLLSFIKPPIADDISIIHGDFHFANIFFDFRSLGVKVIDPRGIVRGVPTIYGDYRYDIAKLAHSVYGLYDFIVAGIYTADVNDSYMIEFDVDLDPFVVKIQNVFGSMTFNGISPQSIEIRAIVILLFLSMLPLHSDDKQRQDTLLANVFRLYVDLLAGK